MSDIVKQFPEAHLPPSAVDVGGAMRVGGRRRRARTVLAVLGTVVVLAGAGATAPALLSTGPGPQPPAEPTCGSPAPARASMQTWQRFDPLTLEIDTSAVTGYEAGIVATATYWQFVTLAASTRLIEPGPVTVFLYACGGDPHGFAGREPAAIDPTDGEPAAEIDGVPAYWLPSTSLFPDGSPVEGLAWQWTPGAWAIVSVEPDADESTVDRTVLRTVATQVAHQIELGVGTPVTAPFSLPVPEGTYPAMTVTHRLEPAPFSIGFNAFGTEEPTHLSVGFAPTLTVDGDATGLVGDVPPGSATAYSEDLGYPAYQDSDGEFDTLLVFDVLGLTLRIITPVGPPGTSTPAENLDVAADVFRTITVYPGAADDPSAWGDPIVP